MIRPLTHAHTQWFFKRAAAVSRLFSHVQGQLTGRGYTHDDPLFRDVSQVNRALMQLQMTLLRLGIEQAKDEAPGFAQRTLCKREPDDSTEP